MTRLLTIVFAPLLITTACERKSAEDKGRDFAEDRVGFADGVAQVVEERGKGLGTKIGKGVGEMVKGAGTAIKDVVHPTINVTARDSVSALGIKVVAGHEGGDQGGRHVTVSIASENVGAGRFRILAFDADDKEIALSAPTKNLALAVGQSETLDLVFPADTRLSQAARFELDALPAKTITLDKKVEKRGIKVSQLAEDGLMITAYFVFEKGFNSGLQVRATDDTGAELARSEVVPLKKEADSAERATFFFPNKSPLDRVSTYTVYEKKPKKAAR